MKYDGENEDSYVEGSVICRYFTGEESPRPISIAQEILRSFDAKTFSRAVTNPVIRFNWPINYIQTM